MGSLGGALSKGRIDLSPKFPPLRSRVLGCRRVSLFDRASFLRSLIAGLLASPNLLFVRPEAPLFVPTHARGYGEVGRRRCRIMVLSAVGPYSVTQAAATWRSGRPVLLMSRARSPLRCGPLWRKRSHRASSRQGRPPTRQPGGTVGGSDASGYPGAIKVAIVFPDDMHDDGEFAGHGHGAPTQADPRR